MTSYPPLQLPESSSSVLNIWSASCSHLSTLGIYSSVGGSSRLGIGLWRNFSKDFAFQSCIGPLLLRTPAALPAKNIPEELLWKRVEIEAMYKRELHCDFSIPNCVIYTCRFRLWRRLSIWRSCAGKSIASEISTGTRSYEDSGLHETGPAEGRAAQIE